MNSRSCMIVLALVFAFCTVILFSAPPVYAMDNETCFSCHGEQTEEIPFVAQGEFESSIHGKNLCISCHTDVKNLPHAEKLAPVSCGSCHRIETTLYTNSEHGRVLSQGVSEAATCTSCHGKTHTLLSSRNPASPVNRRNIPNTCGSCHGDTEKMAKFQLTEKEQLLSYMSSVHGEAFQDRQFTAAVCSDCHGTHDLHPSSDPRSKVNRMNVPKTCGRCHENVSEVYWQSVHGKAVKAGIKEAPVCTNCHGEHTIRRVSDPTSSVWAGSVSKTCSECHESRRIIQKFGLPADRLKTYQESYHGLAAKGGDLKVANCASCHGWHDILPSIDLMSSVNVNNLHSTCGKCHSGADKGNIQGLIHGGRPMGGRRLINFVRLFYYWLIPLLIGSMLFYNLADYLRKALSGRSRSQTHPEIAQEEASVLRLTPNERIQHAVLTITFVILAYTGFALKFQDAWWATPFNLAGGEAVRKSIHHWTALCLVALGLYHAAYMLGTRRGRDLWRRFLPKLRNLADPLLMLAYNLGIKKTRPQPVYPSFAEKMEYFSLIWGAIVMVVTGSFLAFSDYALRYFPLWVTDLATLIHFYEAVLACLAITVWHLYWVIFDPDVYPMNWAWLTGRLLRNENGEKPERDSA